MSLVFVLKPNQKTKIVSFSFYQLVKVGLDDKNILILAYDISNGYESEEIDNFESNNNNNNEDEAELNQDNFNEDDVDVFNEDYNESSNLEDNLKLAFSFFFIN